MYKADSEKNETAIMFFLKKPFSSYEIGLF